MALLVLCALTQPLAAHESIGSVSNAVVTVDGSNTVDYYLRVPAQLRPLMFATSELDYYRDYFNRALRLSSAGSACALVSMSPFSRLPSGNSLVHLRFHCPLPVSALTIDSEALLDVDDRHVQVVRLVRPDALDKVLGEALLEAKHPRADLPVAAAPPLLLARVWRFFKLGVEHILTGLDHVLFILTVILATTGWRDTLKVVTAFTVAHSVTLGLAFFGLVSLPAVIVEPLIAFSILYVALENLFARQVRHRTLLVFAFGLVHGLGFVGVLREISIAKEELISSLFAFNLGIEAGQLLIVAPFLLLLGLARCRPWRSSAIKFASFATGLAGMAWLFDRLPLGSFAGLLKGLA